MDFIEEFIDFLIGASEQTRQHVDAVIKEAISCAVKVTILGSILIINNCYVELI